MPRRSSSSNNPILIIGIIVVFVVILIAGKTLLTKKQEVIPEGEVLNVEAFLQNGNSLRGNNYTVEGLVDEKLRWNSENGRVVSLMVKSATGDIPIPVMVPQNLKQINIERNQRYSFKVTFEKGGVPIATDINPL